MPAKVSFELLPGAVIAGRYRLERALGQGGMGVVWAATHMVTRKRVALKFLKGPLHLRPELRRRFLREARAASAVVHPNVLEVHDVFELDDETPVMLMDLLEGETLGAHVARKGKLSLAETADVLIQVVSAVGTAHAVGVVHRDLKPDNIFLVKGSTSMPSVRVLDFGIAKLVGLEGPTAETGIITGTGSMLGTPCYMSPEQSFGEKAVDYRTDIWSLGVILYECLTGARPVEGDSIGQVVKRLISDGITPIAVALPSLPADATALIDGMLAREREQRPQDLREVLAVLSRYSTVQAPEFGAATQERPESAAGSISDGDGEIGATLESEPGKTRPSDAAPTSHDPKGPETAGAHTMSQAHGARRTPLALWAITGLALLAGGAAIVSRPAAGTSSASGASGPATPVGASAAVARDPVAPAAPTTNPVPLAPTAPAAEPGPTAPQPVANVPMPSATPANRKADRAGAARTPAGAHKAPAANEATTAPQPPPPAPPPAAPRPRVGGLAEKPPF